MWMRQITYEQTEKSVVLISEFHQKQHRLANLPINEIQVQAEREYMETEMDKIRNSQLLNSSIQFVLIMATLVIIFNIFSTQQKREKKLKNEKMRAEESSRAKTIFLSNMSHDIRTPMNAIIGYTKLARREEINSQEIQEFLSKIDSSSHHLLALINDVLEMSRIESGKMQLEEIPCDLRNIMEELRDMFAQQMEGKKILYSVDYSKIKNPLVFCDKNRLNRILLNLVGNAVKFTNENGKVTVSLLQIGDAHEGKSDFELRVKDNGIGMSKKFATKVFDAFERERTSTVSGIQGTGLGMAITKSIVDLMGGEISVLTEQGKGTEFIVKLTLSLQKTNEAEANEEISTSENLQELAEHKEENALDFSKMRLLLVDDMDVNREIAAMLLSEMGFTIETAKNGVEAVEKIELAQAGYFNAVLMDIQMPVMDGYEATRKIRALSDDEKSKIPIIAMTANAFSDDVKKSLEAGMNAHVAKPIDMNVLSATLKKWLV